MLRARRQQQGAVGAAPGSATVAESGVPGYEVNVWFGIVGPAGMPPDVVAKLNTEMNAILQMPDVKQRFAEQGVTPVGGPPQLFADHLKAKSKNGPGWSGTQDPAAGIAEQRAP